MRVAVMDLDDVVVGGTGWVAEYTGKSLFAGVSGNDWLRLRPQHAKNCLRRVVRQASNTNRRPTSSLVMLPLASNVGVVAPLMLVISFCLFAVRV